MYSDIRRAGADILSVAVDLHGPEKARPFHTAARAEFTTVVDESNSLAAAFGFKAIPNGLLVDEQGRLAYKHFSGFDIRKPETVEVLEMFLASGAMPAGVDGAPGRDGLPVATIEHFRSGLARLKAGDPGGAARIWREGVALEPDNWLMRKQLWALENPDRFYAGAIDFAWQKEQIAEGR